MKVIPTGGPLGAEITGIDLSKDVSDADREFIFKAYIDNIVRVGRTFGFDRNREGVPYWPLVADGKKLVILSSRGDYGYDPGERLEQMNHVEGGVAVPLGYIGITDVHSIAIEYDEFADARLQRSIKAAEERVDELVTRLTGKVSQSKVA